MLQNMDRRKEETHSTRVAFVQNVWTCFLQNSSGKGSKVGSRKRTNDQVQILVCATIVI